MNIWWTADWNVNDARTMGGDPHSTRILVDGLRDRGHTLTFMNPIYNGSRLPFYMRVVLTATRFARGLRKGLEEHPPSVIVTQNHMYPYVVREANRANVPVVLVARDKRYRCPQFAKEYEGCSGKCTLCSGKMGLIPYPWFRHHINLSREMAGKTDAQVTVSEHMATDMRTWILGTNPFVIPPPVDDSHMPEVWEPRDVLFTGRGHYKGADIVIDIAREMLDRDFGFRVCGKQEPSHEKEFQALSNVDYLGYVDRRLVYARAAILICPARWDEPSSRSVVEASYIGIPSIVSDVGGQREMQGPSGINLDPRSEPHEWAEMIDKMMDNPAYWMQHSRLAKYHATENYHADRATEKMEKVLEGVT